MIILDFFCPNCGNSLSDVVVKNCDEIILCQICNEKMERKYSATKYSFRPESKTPVPPGLIGGGEKARFYHDR